MSGTFCEISPEKITFVATDAHKLVKHIRTDFSADSTTSFILPRKPLTLLKNTLANDGDLKIEYNEAKKLLKESSSVRKVIEKYKKKES